MARYLRVAVLALVPGLPAAAQTPMEAAALNAELAARTCVQNYQDPAAMIEAFKTAGFAHSTEDFGGGEVLHTFGTPDETVTTTVAVDGISVECRIGTDLWGTEAMLPFAQALMQKIAPALALNPGSPEGQNILPGSAGAQNGACSGFHAFVPRTVLWVQIERQGNDGTCISDGTSVMRMMF